MKTQKTLISLSLLTTLSLGACTFKKKDNNEPTVAEQIQTEKKNEISLAESYEINAENIEIKTTPNARVGFYDIEFSWPKHIPKMKIKINNEPLVIVNSTNKYTFTVESIGTPAKITYHLTSCDESGKEIATQYDILTTDVDFIFDGKLILTESSTFTFNRVEFTKDADVITNTFSMTINARTLIVRPRPYILGLNLREPHIRTFEESSTELPTVSIWPTYVNPAITVATDTGSGQLVVFAQGRDGANGKAGESADQNHNPALDAKTPIYSVETRVRINNGAGAPMTTCYFSRNDKPANGFKGADGHDGQPGHPGQNTTLVDFRATESKDLRLMIYTKPGKGGKGGAGGLGGPGGKGIHGVTLDNCKVIKNNQVRSEDGPRGDDGEAGPDGQNGVSPAPITNLPEDHITIIDQNVSL